MCSVIVNPGDVGGKIVKIWDGCQQCFNLVGGLINFQSPRHLSFPWWRQEGVPLPSPPKRIDQTRTTASSHWTWGTSSCQIITGTCGSSLTDSSQVGAFFLFLLVECDLLIILSSFRSLKNNIHDGLTSIEKRIWEQFEKMYIFLYLFFSKYIWKYVFCLHLTLVTAETFENTNYIWFQYGRLCVSVWSWGEQRRRGSRLQQSPPLQGEDVHPDYSFECFRLAHNPQNDSGASTPDTVKPREVESKFLAFT